MATVQQIPLSPWRAIIETGLHANSVHKTSMTELYNLARRQPEVVATSHPMYNPGRFGLPEDAVVLVSNDGSVVGRTARARLLVRTFAKNQSDTIQALLREAVYQFNKRPALHLEGVIGLHADFMIKAHLLSPVTDAKNMLDWGINFCPFITPWSDMYDQSRVIREPDIIAFADPDWRHPDYPHGCVIIDEMSNCIAILGLRYFGERKKGTLTLAWTIGVRHNMVACHGGIKKIGDLPPVAVFGLSGSGKSSITNSLDHEGLLRAEEKVTVIHDDAFLIDLERDFSVALEPSLFDKTDAVIFDDPQLEYFYSAQNVGVMAMPDGSKRIVAQDVRNSNGRCLKSRDMFRHAGHCQRPGTLIWLQKDTSLPPISKVMSSSLAVAMGASLSTMRAKGVENVDARELQKLVIEPFANPFRVHSLLEDCEQFRQLFKMGCECYIMNTHAFGMGDDLENIPKELSLAIVTALVRGQIQWREWRTFKGLLVPKNGPDCFGADFDRRFKPSRNPTYLRFQRDRMQDRITFLSRKRDEEQDMANTFIAPLVSARLTIDRILEPDLYR
ncbi:MAG: phosphoenolpyruvate carboxykinase (ATP) [Proteobacteria bacterium]|nr:phosphoenolpyruvate carboxykinase (ATP) [Pseudomonadota bacterium]MBU1641595.1 phosphoenolpyruvate carboxykinase (ATP) [Pseudomonadota bacterium]